MLIRITITHRDYFNLKDFVVFIFTLKIFFWDFVKVLCQREIIGFDNKECLLFGFYSKDLKLWQVDEFEMIILTKFMDTKYIECIVEFAYVTITIRKMNYKDFFIFLSLKDYKFNFVSYRFKRSKLYLWWIYKFEFKIESDDSVQNLIFFGIN